MADAASGAIFQVLARSLHFPTSFLEMSAQSPINFADPAAVLQLVPGSGQRLVCLSFPDGTHLFSHPVALALTSGVLRNVLEDTQEQQTKEQYTTIPLDDSTDAVASWQLALAFMHHQTSGRITMDNAQGLLLLSHKYEVTSIAVPVSEFLMVCEPGTSSSRLAQQLKPETVVGWLSAVSRCGLQQAVKLCIDFIVGRRLPVSFDTLCSLHRTDADQLLAAMHAVVTRAAARDSRLADTFKDLGCVRELYRYKCCGKEWFTNDPDAAMACAACGQRKRKSLNVISLGALLG